MFSNTKKLSILVLCLLFFALTASGGDDWKPLDPAEMALKSPVVDKDADAEVLVWEVRVDDASEEGLIFTNYIRLKVFTERGKESQSKVDIPYLSGHKIEDIKARTVKPDGTIIELKKDDIHERTIVKVSGIKLKAKSFAVPGIEPGVIVEYRWKDVRYSTGLAGYTRLQFQREIPIQKVTYLVKPYAGVLPMRYQPFQLPASVTFVKDKGGYFSASLTNVPAYSEEAYMPPEDSVRSWILIFYSLDKKLVPEKYWKDFGKIVWDVFKGDMKVNDDIRRTATEVVGDAATPEEKLERIYTFCRTKIRNLTSDSSGLSKEELEKVKASKSASDTLKKAAGSGMGIDMLFAAMATAVGFEPRPALVADRSDIFFDPQFADPYFLEPSSIAIKVGDSWKFFNPGYNYLPFGMLRWQEEGQDALIADPKEPSWSFTPLNPPEKSQNKRTGRFRLLEDGTLEGKVSVITTGQIAVERKNDEDDESPIERENSLRDGIKARMSTAEVSDIKIENVNDPLKPYEYSYTVRIPGYAQRTGKRLFLQPGFFKRGIEPLFSSSERKNQIYFHYPWSEEDDITIALPGGYVLDNADTPQQVLAGKLANHAIAMGITNDMKTLVYKRKFFFGGGDGKLERLLYPTSVYPKMKAFFDAVHTADSHVITLKQGSTASIPNPSN
jgi:hypothetical protein